MLRAFLLHPGSSFCLYARRSRWLAVLVPLVAHLLLPSSVPAQVVLTSCGSKIDQEGVAVVLGSDLDCASSDAAGIRVQADAVRLDCQGFSINGAGEDDTYGIQIEPVGSSAGIGEISVQNCTVRGFWAGIRFSNVSNCRKEDESCVVEKSIFEKNTQYGVQLRRESTNIIVRNNTIRDNGDEGVHISGTDQAKSPVCDAAIGGFGDNLVVCNSIGAQHREGIYLLCSEGNEVRDNCVGSGRVASEAGCSADGSFPIACTVESGLSANGAAGIRLNRYSKRNRVRQNSLDGNSIELNEKSTSNSLDENSVRGRPLRFKDFSSNNIVSAARIEDSNTEAYDFQDSSCNLIRDSAGTTEAGGDPQIQATGEANDNLFLGLSLAVAPGVEPELRCDVSAAATVRVCADDGTVLGCAGHDSIDPSGCAWADEFGGACP